MAELETSFEKSVSLEEKASLDAKTADPSEEKSSAPIVMITTSTPYIMGNSCVFECSTDIGKMMLIFLI
jgi:hypothetical protein